MRWKSEDINWSHVVKALENPKTDEHGEEFIDVTTWEMAAIDKLAEVCKGFRVAENDQLSVCARRHNDRKFREFDQKQFAYLKLAPI